MASPPDEGFGASITFQTGFFAKITNISWSGISRNSLETTHNASTANAKTFIPSSVYDPGEMALDLRLDPDMSTLVTAMTASPETVTLTFPINPDKTTAATWAASGFLTELGALVPMDDVMGMTANLKFTGPITVTSSCS